MQLLSSFEVVNKIFKVIEKLKTDLTGISFDISFAPNIKRNVVFKLMSRLECFNFLEHNACLVSPNNECRRGLVKKQKKVCKNTANNH